MATNSPPLEANMQVDLDELPQLADLFKLFLSGAHLNRQADAALWAGLENQQKAYTTLFCRFGYDLQIDGRGFAWFQHNDITSQVSQQSRQLALLFMVLFDTQADAGKPLNRFGDWVIDDQLVKKIRKAHQEVLEAENLDYEGLVSLFNKAVAFGFAQRKKGHWQLLPAVCRYLDHFEAVVAAEKADVPDMEEESP